MINRLINELVQYGISKHLVEEDDRVYVTNRLLELFGQMEFSEEITEERPLAEILEDMCTYAFKNGTTVELNETYKDIKFSLKIDDNLLESDEEDQYVNCSLSYGAPFQVKRKAKIECIGKKDKKAEQNNNVDISLNWKLKVNNNFTNIIISWPKTIDESYKKNIYSYHLTGLSIRQSNFACNSNNFDFYVYIYNLYHEPKISFNLPLTLPKNEMAKCDLFDKTALKCSLNLKHKKLSKGDRVMLPELGSKNEIFTLDGNIIYFIMNNFSKINNDHDFYVNLEEECGD